MKHYRSARLLRGLLTSATTNHSRQVLCRSATVAGTSQCHPFATSVNAERTQPEALTSDIVAAKLKQVTFHDIRSLLVNKGLPESDLRRRPYHDTHVVSIRECPFCHAIKGDITNMWTCGIFEKSGSVNCFRCAARMEWCRFQELIALRGVFNLHSDSHSMAALRSPLEEHRSAIGLPSHFTEDSDNQFFFDDYEEDADSGESIIESYLVPHKIPDEAVDGYCDALLLDTTKVAFANRIVKHRGIGFDTLRRYKVGFGYHQFASDLAHIRQKGGDASQLIPRGCIMFPQSAVRRTAAHSADELRGTNVDVLRYKLRTVNGKQFAQYPATADEGLFGLHCHPRYDSHAAVSGQHSDDDELQLQRRTLVICEGEYDAMAVNQSTDSRTTAVSTANGANLPRRRVLQSLAADFDNVLLFADWDAAGHRLCADFANAMKEFSVNFAIVTRDEYCSAFKDVRNIELAEKCKDANDLLRSGLPLDLVRHFEDFRLF